MPRLAHPALAIAAALALSACASAGHVSGADPAADSATLMRLAETTQASGNAGAAIPLWRRAHALAPENPVPLAGLARALMQAGATGEALDAWAEAARLAPDDPAIVAGRAGAYLAAGQPQHAVPMLEAAIAKAPSPGLWNRLGVARDMLGEAGNAEAAYRAGLALAPEDARLATNLALSLAVAGRTGEAARLLEAALARPGAGPRQRQNLSLVYALGGEGERAARLGRVDLDDEAVRGNLAAADAIRDLPNHPDKVAAAGALGAGR